MGTIHKILFPYGVAPDTPPQVPPGERKVIFFGTNFLGPALPLGWDETLFIERTNEMLSYIRRHFSGYQLIYQPHPNETNETDYFDMSGFTVGEKTIAELFLYANAASIEYVFSACSNASTSAFSMGLPAAVFLDTLTGALPEDSITVYHGYFAGLPDYFFIKSFDEGPAPREQHSQEGELQGAQQLRSLLSKEGRIWFLCVDPALALRAAIVIRELRKDNKHLFAGLLQSHHRRWDLLSSFGSFLSEFSTTVLLQNYRILYSVRPSMILRAFRMARSLRGLDIRPGDTLVSFSNLLFEEDYILSHYPCAKKVLIIENRWFDFIYENGHSCVSPSLFHTPLGVRMFNIFVEFPLRLYQTVFLEFPDKTINIFRYKKPLEDIYDDVVVLMPWDQGRSKSMQES